MQDHRQQDDVVALREAGVGEEVTSHCPDAVLEPGLFYLLGRDLGDERQVVDRGAQVWVALAQLDVVCTGTAADVQQASEGTEVHGLAKSASSERRDRVHGFPK